MNVDTKIEQVSQQPASITLESLSVTNSELMQKIKQICVQRFCFYPHTWTSNCLKNISATDAKQILDHLFLEMAEGTFQSDPVDLLHRLSALIPLETVQQAVGSDAQAALKEAQEMFEQAKLYLQMSHKERPVTVQEWISRAIDLVVSTIESIITAFGVRDFFRPAENESHARANSEKISTLLRLFTMVTALILPLVGAVVGGWVVGGALLGIAALSLLWPYIKPKTTHLPANAENWTKQVQSSSTLIQGRRESLDAIASTLKMNRHVMLVGPSRVGKTLTAKAFVQAIARGDYPEFSGWTAFRINAADLIGQKASLLGGGNNILYKISETMGIQRDKILLIVDEIHMTCRNNEKMADQLKTFWMKAEIFRM